MYKALKIFSQAVLAFIGAAVAYEGYTCAAYWTGIGV